MNGWQIWGAVATLCGAIATLAVQPSLRRSVLVLLRTRSLRDAMMRFAHTNASTMLALLLACGMVLALCALVRTILVAVTHENADAGTASASTSHAGSSADERPPETTCAAIAHLAPRYPRCPAQAYMDTHGTCEVPPEFFALSTGSPEQDYSGYCAYLLAIERKASRARER